MWGLQGASPVPWCSPKTFGAAPKLSVLPQNAHGSARGAAWSGRSARCRREQAGCRLPGCDLKWGTHTRNPVWARVLPQHSPAEVCGVRGERGWAAWSG